MMFVNLFTITFTCMMDWRHLLQKQRQSTWWTNKSNTEKQQNTFVFTKSLQTVKMWWNHPIDDIRFELRKLNYCVDICNLPVSCTTQFRNACCWTWTVICLFSKFLMLINLTSAEAFFRHWTVSLIQWDLLEPDPFFDSFGVVCLGGRVQSYPWERRIQFSIQTKSPLQNF